MSLSKFTKEKSLSQRLRCMKKQVIKITLKLNPTVSQNADSKNSKAKMNSAKLIERQKITLVTDLLLAVGRSINEQPKKTNSIKI